VSANQDATMAQLLAELSLLPHGSTTSYNPSGSGGDSSESQGGKRPPGESYPDQERLRDAYVRCWTDHGRERVIEDARRTLREWRGIIPRPSPRDETLDELKARIVREGDGWSVRDVALHMRCSERLVIDARREHEMHELRRQGKSDQEIAERLGVHRTTVTRTLPAKGRKAA
jgi:hypothetical protein